MTNSVNLSVNNCSLQDGNLTYDIIDWFGTEPSEVINSWVSGSKKTVGLSGFTDEYAYLNGTSINITLTADQLTIYGDSEYFQNFINENTVDGNVMVEFINFNIKW